MHRTEKTNIRTAALYWMITAGYMGLIYYLSSRHLFDFPWLSRNFDKVLHTGIYIPLAFLFYVSFFKSGVKRFVFLISFLCASLYGVADELHQTFVPGRVPSVGDVIADVVGSFIGSVGASFFRS